MKAFGEATDKESSPINQSVKELTGTILQEVKRLPGNQVCCDCSASGTIYYFLFDCKVHVSFVYILKDEDSSTRSDDLYCTQR